MLVVFAGLIVILLAALSEEPISKKSGEVMQVEPARLHPLSV
jgi:hypothetical protein